MERSHEMGIFVRVVDEGGLSAAARALNLAPSTISKIMTRLEERLGVRLMNRTTRQFKLTAEGEEFYKRSRAIIQEIEEAEASVSRAKSELTGPLKVISMVAFGNYQLVPIIPEFLARHPGVHIDLTLTDGKMDVIEAGADVGVLHGNLPDSSLIVHRLVDDRRVVVASPDYLKRFGAPREPEDLLKHNCIIWWNAQRHLNRWPFDGGRVVTVKGNVMVDNGETLVRMAMAGAGLIRLAEFVAGAAIRDGLLVPVLTEHTKDDTLPIYAIFPHRQHLASKVRAFVDFLDEKFSPVPPWRQG
ncbi:LysR family transcriptional regulator [Shumkonia mesophila]|uniref:LysR family transcriptional regulator n=1 Tax=Shumkonia mesophila TaxID=2838854 RepID=UPI002934B2CA|nr:LysR family transcriptional regulator [Shumkonia mesophila]